MFFLTPRYIKDAKQYVHGAKKFLSYKKDILPADRIQEILSRITDLKSAIRSRSRPGNPLARAVVQSSSTVQRCRHFHAHPRGFADHAAEETDVEFAGLNSQRMVRWQYLDFHARSPQFSKAVAGHQWVGVKVGRHHLFDARLNQRIAAGASAAVVRAWLQGNVSRGANY
jgi:hypothetical protein